MQDLINKAITLLKNDQALGKPANETYLLAIEQSYLCMTDLFHFLEAGSMLTTLTKSALITGTMELLLNWSAHPYLPMKVFKRVATFLR